MVSASWERPSIFVIPISHECIPDANLSSRSLNTIKSIGGVGYAVLPNNPDTHLAEGLSASYLFRARPLRPAAPAYAIRPPARKRGPARARGARQDAGR